MAHLENEHIVPFVMPTLHRNGRFSQPWINSVLSACSVLVWVSYLSFLRFLIAVKAPVEVFGALCKEVDDIQ